MKFYQDQFPKVHEITMCTVISCDPATGFIVNLDEYDVEGFLVNKELSAKKIRKTISSFLKVGTQLPLSVIEANISSMTLSKKDVRGTSDKDCLARYQLNEKLFSLARRLSHLTDINEEIWSDAFRAVQNVDNDPDEHPYSILGDRSADKSELGIAQNLLDLIELHHAKLFGINPLTMRKDFVIQTLRIDGMEHVKQALIRIRDSDSWNKKTAEGKSGLYTNEELHTDPNAVNVAILPLAIPTFQLQITAYKQDRCNVAFEQIKTTLEGEKFDYLEFKAQK
jgi:translation initiation factor 2 alpha subunit (eIF-2alpha)